MPLNKSPWPTAIKRLIQSQTETHRRRKTRSYWPTFIIISKPTTIIKLEDHLIYLSLWYICFEVRIPKHVRISRKASDQCLCSGLPSPRGLFFLFALVCVFLCLFCKFFGVFLRSSLLSSHVGPLNQTNQIKFGISAPNWILRITLP